METAAPVRREERIFVLDVIRGIATCGILILNIAVFARPLVLIPNLNVFHETSLPNIVSWYITNFLLNGSFRALFSMFFGTSAVLIISHLAKNSPSLTPADIYYQRLIWLLIFGFIDAFVLLWTGDIL